MIACPRTHLTYQTYCELEADGLVEVRVLQLIPVFKGVEWVVFTVRRTLKGLPSIETTNAMLQEALKK